MSNEQHNAPDVALPTGLPGDIAPPLAHTADALLREVCAELDALDCGACTGSMAPMEDLHGRIVDHLAARQPGAQELPPRGFIVTGLTDAQLVDKMVEIGHAEQVLQLLLMKIGTPAGTKLVADLPAQGIDLVRALDIMWDWQEQLGGHVFDARDVARTLTSSDMQAIGVDARACIDATDRNQAIVLAKREIVRALSSGQRGAAGVSP